MCIIQHEGEFTAIRSQNFGDLQVLRMVQTSYWQVVGFGEAQGNPKSTKSRGTRSDLHRRVFRQTLHIGDWRYRVLLSGNFFIFEISTELLTMMRNNNYYYIIKLIYNVWYKYYTFSVNIKYRLKNSGRNSHGRICLDLIILC